MPVKKTTKKKPLVSKKKKEEFKVEGKKVVSKVKALIKEGNIRKLTVKDNKGKVIMSIPVNVGILGAVFVPPLIVLGALAAMVTSCTITVERK